MNLSKPARQIYDLAYELANQRHDQAVDGLHLILAVMQNSQLAGRAGEAFGELEAGQKVLWAMFIQYELDVHRPEVASADFKSARLLSYERAWASTMTQWAQVTSVQIVDTLLRNDLALARMMFYCRVDHPALLRALAERAALNDEVVSGSPLPVGGLPGPYSTPLPVPRMAPDTLPFISSSMGTTTDPWMRIPPVPPVPYLDVLRSPYAGRGLLQRIGRPITATPAGLYAHIHPPISTQLIDSLSEGRRGREITVFAGKCGTAAQAVPQVIADRLAHVDRSNPLGAIRDLTGITVVHVGDLLDETQRDTPSAQDIQGLFQEARDRRVILVMEDAELLAKDFGDFELREQILRELGRSSDVPIFAIYHLGEDERYEAGRVSLGLHNAEPVQLLPDSDERTRTLLKTYFRPYWQQQGYIIHDPEKAFELLFKLVPDIRVVRHRSGKSWDERKLLPYAVIDVGTEAIEMLAKNQDVLYVAQAALSALGPIRTREREIERSEMRDALKRAEEDIRKLVSKTKPDYRTQMPMELTRAHLMAQFFYPSGTQFRPFVTKPDDVVPVHWTAGTPGEVERRQP